MIEGKTLRELNVQPGDVVRCVAAHGGETYRGANPHVIRIRHGELEAVDNDGRYYDEDSTARFIVEIRDNLPPGHVHLASGEVVDLTANRIAHGLLDPEVRAAMEAHGGPYDLFTVSGAWYGLVDSAWHPGNTYRVRPAPVVQTVKRSLHGEKFMGYVAIDLINGEPDWSTMRKWEDAA